MTNKTGNAAAAGLTITAAKQEAPQAIVTIIPEVNSELPAVEVSPDAVPLTAEEYDEHKRLLSRVQAEPTSFRAQQELASFKALKGIA